jgi:hypothetical protein
MATPESENVMSLLSKRELRRMDDPIRLAYLRRHEISKIVYLARKEISQEFNPEINRLKAMRDAKYAEIMQWRDEVYESEGL